MSAEHGRAHDWPFPGRPAKGYASLAERMADPDIQAGRAQALANCAAGTGVFSQRDPTPPKMQIDADMVERACRAHWPSFDRMRPDHAAEKRVKMQAALAAALYGGRLRP